MSKDVSKTYTNKFSFGFEKGTIKVTLDPICPWFRPNWSSRLHIIIETVAPHVIADHIRARTQYACALTSFCSYKQTLRVRQILHKIATNLARLSISSTLRMAKILDEKVPLDIMYDSILSQKFASFQQSVANLQCINMCISSSRSIFANHTR